MGNTNVRPHPKPRSKKQVRWKAADRPSPPGKPSLVQENGLIPDVVNICWLKPERDGGSPIASYLVEHRRLGTTFWIKSNILPVTTTELAVQGLEPGWRYQFRIRAENVVGLSDPSEISEPFTVTLQRSAILSPKFTQTLQDTTIIENDKVEFEVHFLGQPIPNICWFRDGFEIFSDGRTRITTVSDKSVLTFVKTLASDEGEIRCSATNKAGHASTRAKLTIEAPPSIRLPKSYQEQDGIIFEIGEQIKFNIWVYGRPTPLLFWSHDGESLQNDDRHEIEFNDRTATITIENALRSDRGEYSLRAVNKLGQDSASFLVTITDKPTPPGKARVLLTSGKSVTLCWSTPIDDGGARIGNYIIEYYRMGWDVWLKAATSKNVSTVLGDLIEGSQYKFRVKAESLYGVSEPSEESETVFVTTHKNESKNTSQTEISIPPPDALRRRRESASPRVSFALNEDTPVRPERKKTGKTPEASPRMKRKQIPLPYDTHDISPKRSPTPRKFSLPDSEIKFPSATRKESPKHSPTSPLRHQSGFNFTEAPLRKTSPLKSLNRNETKSPSPEIIITDTDRDGEQRSPSRSPRRSPNRRRNLSEGDNSDISLSPTSLEKLMIPEKAKILVRNEVKSPNPDNRMRPPLTHQNFSGSSEFMLVLCPEEEQGAQFKRLSMSFDENSVPPPLSLSAPELGFEPQDQPSLRHSLSSTELLTYRLMERMNEEDILEVRKHDAKQTEGNMDIPEIQVNSKPSKELVGLDRVPSLTRRLSSGISLKQKLIWSQRRQSLQDSLEVDEFRDNNLHKFEGSDGSKINEFAKDNEEEDEDDWMKGYEESIPSEEDSESIEEEKYATNYSPQITFNEENEQETYSPRNRMITSISTNDDRPFEILTVRKDPPNGNIIPKPILKKKPSSNDHNKQKESDFYIPSPQRNRSGSLTNSEDLKEYTRNRSNSLIGAYDELIDINEIKKSPTTAKRRSFSLIPTQANFIKDAFKSKNKKDVPSTSSPKQTPMKMNVSALATSTSIAGAGLVIPDKLTEKKVESQETKAVVDFYGDIVKNLGAKSKPMAEFSKTIVSKYDTFEERRISEIKPNVESSHDKPKSDFIPIVKMIPTPKAVEQREPIVQPRANVAKPSPQSQIPRYYGNIVKNNSPDRYTKENTSPIRSNIARQERNKSKSPVRPIEYEDRSRSRKDKSISPTNAYIQREETPKSRSSSATRKRKTPRSRDASTSPVRFSNWDDRSSSRNSLERDYYGRSSLTSSRASSLTRRTPSPARPKLKEITTQTSFRIESKTPADVLKQQEELATKAEKRMKGILEYFTDLAMVSVACWFYLFHNEYLAIPILVVLIYRQLSEKLSEYKEKLKNRVPNWIMKKFKKERTE